jgi:hypothetical protein
VTNLGHPAHPRPKGTGDHNLPEKRGQAMSARRTPRKTRVVWPRLDCFKSNPDRDTGSPAVTLTQRGVTACRVFVFCIRHARAVRYREMIPGVGMNGRPKPRSDVRWPESSGSPTGREPYGDGVLVVVGVRESRTHGEGGQVDLMAARGGTRHAGRRDDAAHH